MRFAAINLKEASPFVKQNHYSHGHHNGPALSVGAFDDQGQLSGVLMFATPCSENVRASIFGPDEKDRVTELHRLVLVDDTPKNTESQMIAASMRLLLEKRPQTRAVISFADPTAGHVGTIYQATNFLYCGTSSPAKFYLDEQGRLRHPRQNGVNVSVADAASRGWTPTKRQGKHRYVLIVAPDHSELRKWRRRFLLTPQAYPKRRSVDNV